MNSFDLMNEIGKITDMDSMMDFVIIGFVLGMVGFTAFKISTGGVPGIAGMVLPGAAGAVLGAMLYIFAIGTSGG